MTGAGELRVGLFDPGMTATHRTGLGGLALTLANLPEPSRAGLARHGSAEVEPDGRAIRFRWADPAFWSALLAAAFPPTGDGLVRFPAYPGPPRYADLFRHDALLGTLLQHPGTREAEPVGQPGTGRAAAGEPPEAFVYRRVGWYAHQRVAFDPARDAVAKSWLVPGATDRHQAFPETRHREPPGAWLSALFLPVGAVPFRAVSAGEGARPRWALACPDLPSIGAYAALLADVRGRPSAWFVAAGLVDAALRVLAAVPEADRGAAGVEVHGWGTTAWNLRQRSRVAVLRVGSEDRADLDGHAAALAHLPPLPPAPGGEPRPVGADWTVHPALELAAGNALAGRPWWVGFSGVEDAPAAGVYAAAVRTRPDAGAEAVGLPALVRETVVRPERPALPGGLLTTADVAAALGVSERRVQQLAAARGVGSGGGRNRPLLFAPDDVERLRPGPRGRPPKT